MIAFKSSRLIRSEPGGIAVVSEASCEAFDVKMVAPPSRVILSPERSAIVRSPRGTAAGGASEDSDAGRSGPSCTGISRRRAPSRVRYIRALSIDTFRCSFLSNFACRFASSIAIRSLFCSAWTIPSVRALGLGHVGPQLRDVAIVADALEQQPGVDGDHRCQPDAEHEHESRIGAAEIAPSAAAAIAFVGPGGAASRLWPRLFRSEDLHCAPSCPAEVRVGLHY